MSIAVLQANSISEIPDLPDWNLAAGARWTERGRQACSSSEPFGDILSTPLFPVEKGRTYRFTVSLQVVRGGICFFVVRNKARHYVEARPVTDTSVPVTCTLRLRFRKKGWYQLCLGNFNADARSSEVRLLEFTAIEEEEEEPLADGIGLPSTHLPHWGALRRWLHDRCKASRSFNSVVAGIELRLGCEELISLPQYMALCPTGICNALCSFCSVTQNRGGIPKKELQIDKLEQFLAPVRGTIRTYGLEGNGEPTIYSRFDELVERLGRDGADIYLITNGERMRADQVPALMANHVKSFNFSLNAATAETHQAIMKLKGFESVLANIRSLVRARAHNWPPRVSVSMVVTQLNIHEVVAFLALAETELNVDCILIRPLSELGDDSGAVEDLRSIVPYESDVRDMIDAVQEYLVLRPPRAQVDFVPENFRSFRKDPLDSVVMPTGFDNRLLAPRRGHWSFATEHLDIEFTLTGFRLRFSGGGGAAGILAVSGPIPVNPRKSLIFLFRYRGRLAPFKLVVLDDQDREMAVKDLSGGTGEEAFQEASLVVPVLESRSLRLQIRHSGSSGAVDLDFYRLRTPSNDPGVGFTLPPKERWRIESPGAEVTWTGRQVEVRWRGAAGPYLLKSYGISCWPHSTISLPMKARVDRGRLGIGILDESGRHWLKTLDLEPGDHQPDFRFEAGDNRKLHIVIYSCQEGELAAIIGWNEMATVSRSASAPVRSPIPGLVEATHPADAAGSPAASDVATPSPAPAGGRVGGDVNAQNQVSEPNGFGRQTALASIRGGAKERRIFCQKPWTDLNNFSVDGRMDVCCIATGASQKRYALGNIYEDQFQHIWNGETMRAFRRTVNTTEKLPPCQRCPMAYRYEGPMFSEERTRGLMDQAIESSIRVKPLRKALMTIGSWLIAKALFRRFR